MSSITPIRTALFSYNPFSQTQQELKAAGVVAINAEPEPENVDWIRRAQLDLGVVTTSCEENIRVHKTLCRALKYNVALNELD